MDKSFMNIDELLSTLEVRTTGGKQLQRDCKKDIEIGKEIGEGAYGKVYLCINKTNNQTMALKEVPKAVKSQRTIREIENLTLLKHPNIVELYGFFFDEKYIYMVFEYCPLGNLYNLLRDEGVLTEKQSALYIRDIAKALSFCHANNVYHRDIKPDNILITSNNMAKLCDFGFSVHITDGQFIRQSSYGTIDYVSPEMLSGWHNVKTDLWSLGCVIYELVYGVPPFFDQSKEKTFKNIETVNITYPPAFSKDLIDLLKKLLVLLPDLRISVDDILKDKWIEINTKN
jgi:serine/threonine protein kinase